MKIILLGFFILFSSWIKGYSQFSVSEEHSTAFFFDAICFKNDSISAENVGRVDIYVLIPYQALTFEKHGDIFGARYEVYFELYDSTGQKLNSTKKTGKVTEEDYYVTQGGNAEFEKLHDEFFVPKGKYQVQLTLIDQLSRNSYKKSRDISVVDFDRYDMSLSGMMLISTIEEKNGRYVITPHISDNIGMLDDGFFIFFEAYNAGDYQKLDFAYQITDADNKIITKSSKFREDVSKKISRHYKKVTIPPNTLQGIYNLRLFALKPTDSEDYSEEDYLAITERSIKYYKAISGYIMKDIDQAIRYLRYVAENSDLEYIESAPNLSEKQKRLEEFWKKLDPSPGTDRNVAFDEYFSRIEYANKNFKSYTEGWLTDMGMVFIVMGPPAYTDQSTYSPGRSAYIKWSYGNGREFVFVDDSGLGDYRLARSYPFMEKYKYK